MKNETLLTALSDISDKYILEAAPVKKIVPFRTKLYKFMAMAACFVIIFSGVYTTRAYAKPISYINVDVNPSIEFCLNKWNRVVYVKTYNEEAKKICDRLSLKYKNYKDAIEELMCDEDFKAYCQDDPFSDLTITIVSDNYKDLESELQSCVSVKANHGIIRYADQKTAKLAHENNCSVGKYAAYEELQKYDSTVTLDHCNEMTMHELHDEIQSHHGENHDESKHKNTNCNTTAAATNCDTSQASAGCETAQAAESCESQKDSEDCNEKKSSEHHEKKKHHKDDHH